MLDTTLAPIIESLRRYTAFRAWFAEVLLLFSLLLLARLAAQVWESVVLDDATVWAAWWGAYDGARAMADDSLVIAIALTALIEGGIMFLAKKRIAIAREDGFKEGFEKGYKQGFDEGRKKGRAEERAALAAQIAVLTAINEQLQEELRQLRAARAATPTYY